MLDCRIGKKEEVQNILYRNLMLVENSIFMFVSGNFFIYALLALPLDSVGLQISHP